MVSKVSHTVCLVSYTRAPCFFRSPARAHTHHGLKDKVKSVAALEMHEEQAPEGESCKMIVLYCIFGIAYLQTPTPTPFGRH